MVKMHISEGMGLGSDAILYISENAQRFTRHMPSQNVGKNAHLSYFRFHQFATMAILLDRNVPAVHTSFIHQSREQSEEGFLIVSSSI